MTKNHSRIIKLCISFFAIFKILKNRSQFNGFFTYLYKQSIFAPHSDIQFMSIEEYFSQLNSPIKYIVSNFILSNDLTNRASCTGTEELIQLMSLVQFKNPKTLLELGTNRGGTTYNFFLNTSQDCTIFTIDMLNIPCATPEIQNIFDSSRINRITCDTKEVPDNILEKKFDFIFVDAGHNYVDIKNDSELALKLIERDGFIVWHDFSTIEPDVVNYLNELSKEIQLIHLLNGTLVIYRKQE